MPWWACVSSDNWPYGMRLTTGSGPLSRLVLFLSTNRAPMVFLLAPLGNSWRPAGTAGLRVPADDSSLALLTTSFKETSIMWFPSWLRNLLPGSAPLSSRSARRRTPSRRPTSLRLQLELLEDRTVPSGLGFSTYLGGGSNDYAYAVAVDHTGNTYVAGLTTSINFPTTKGALQPRFGGGNTDAFVAKFDANGALLYSTYLGGKG